MYGAKLTVKCNIHRPDKFYKMCWHLLRNFQRHGCGASSTTTKIPPARLLDRGKVCPMLMGKVYWLPTLEKEGPDVDHSQKADGVDLGWIVCSTMVDGGLCWRRMDDGRADGAKARDATIFCNHGDGENGGKKRIHVEYLFNFKINIKTFKCIFLFIFKFKFS